MATLKYAYAGAGVKDDTSVSVQNLLIYYPDDGNNHKYVTFSGGSRGFLLVLKNYPLSELKIFFVALWLLQQDQIVSELFSKFHMHI